MTAKEVDPAEYQRILEENRELHRRIEALESPMPEREAALEEKLRAHIARFEENKASVRRLLSFGPTVIARRKSS